MTEAELEDYRRRLLELADRLGGDVPRLRAVAAGEGGGQEDPATLDADEDLALHLLEREEPLLGDARAALDRIERGLFGRCERCGKSISRERLRAVPYTRYCFTCARSREGGER